MTRYSIELYCGKVYVGNADFDSMEKCIQFAVDDCFCDKAVIYDSIGKIKFTVKIAREA